MLKKNILVYALILLIGFETISQSKQFDNVVNLQQQSGGVIYENDNVSGYYFFYSIGSAKKGVKTFILNILDENLNDVNTVTFEEGKKTYLVDGNFNGKNIILKFYDRKAKTMSHLYFDTKGELLYRTNRDFIPSSITTVNDDGFADYMQDTYDKSYTISFLPTVNEQGLPLGNTWVKEFSSSDPKVFSSAEFLCSTEKLIVYLVTNKRTRAAAKVEFRIQAIDINTGKEVFNVELDDTYNNQPLKAYYSKVDRSINLLGLFYSPDSKALKDNGLGLFKYELSLEGKVIDKKNLFWTQELRKFVTIDNNGMAESEERKGFLYFHEIIQHDDGSILAVAEQYRKVADAGGIALNVIGAALGGGATASTTKIQVYDMAVFHFNPDFSVRNVFFIPKTKSNVILPYALDFTNVHLLSYYVKAVGGFDYLFSTQNEQDGATSIAYMDYEKLEDGPKRWVFHAATLFDDEFIEDELPLGNASDTKNMLIWPGKPGNIVIIEYDKEEETLSVYLEKINY